MTWIGLWDKHSGGQFDPEGLGDAALRPALDTRRTDPHLSGRRPSPDSLLAKGTLLVEFEIEPADVRQNLIRFSTREPWHSSLTLCIDPDNSLRLLMGQTDRSFAATLPLPLGRARHRVIVTFVWDGPASQAVLSARIPDLDHSELAELRQPLLPSLRDAQRIVMGGDLCRIAPGVVFVALSNACEPIGPVATLGGNAMIQTASGPKPISLLRPGDFVDTIDDAPAQVRWVGYQDLPARGSFTPHLLRSPYFGLTQDLLLAPDQKLRLGGSEIEYTFGQVSVLASVRHLADGTSILRPPGITIVRYWQVLLDQHTVMRVSGTALESLDAGVFLSDPDQRRHSILRDLPLELIPRGRLMLVPSLQAFEAVRLAR